MIEAVLSIEVPGWIGEISGRYPKGMKVIGCVPYGEEGARNLLEIDVPEGVGDAASAIKSHPSISEAEVVPFGKRKALAYISTTKCPVCSTFAGSECFLASARIKEGKIRWRLLAGKREAVRKLIDKLRKTGFSVEIVRMTDIKSREELTSRQEEIVKIALEKGYFDYPKKISIRELAGIVGISISTLSEVLRSGQRKIIGSYFKEEKI